MNGDFRRTPIFPDEDNTSPSIHPLRTLSLWLRIGVSERPALERTIEWLNSLESGAKLDTNAARRAQQRSSASRCDLE